MDQMVVRKLLPKIQGDILAYLSMKWCEIFSRAVKSAIKDAFLELWYVLMNESVSTVGKIRTFI